MTDWPDSFSPAMREVANKLPLQGLKFLQSADLANRILESVEETESDIPGKRPRLTIHDHDAFAEWCRRYRRRPARRGFIDPVEAEAHAKLGEAIAKVRESIQ